MGHFGNIRKIRLAGGATARPHAAEERQRRVAVGSPRARRLGSRNGYCSHRLRLPPPPAWRGAQSMDRVLSLSPIKETRYMLSAMTRLSLDKTRIRSCYPRCPCHGISLKAVLRVLCLVPQDCHRTMVHTRSTNPLLSRARKLFATSSPLYSLAE